MELSTRETRRAVVERLHTLDEWQQYLSGRHGVDTPEAQRRLLRDAIQRARTPPAKDGRKYADSHYRDVARLYLDLLDHGHGRATIVQLARQLNVSPTTARNWVHRARQLGFLSAGQQGRAGANPGPRLQHSDLHQEPRPSR